MHRVVYLTTDAMPSVPRVGTQRTPKSQRPGRTRRQPHAQNRPRRTKSLQRQNHQHPTLRAGKHRIPLARSRPRKLPLPRNHATPPRFDHFRHEINGRHRRSLRPTIPRPRKRTRIRRLRQLPPPRETQNARRRTRHLRHRYDRRRRMVPPAFQTDWDQFMQDMATLARLAPSTITPGSPIEISIAANGGAWAALRCKEPKTGHEFLEVRQFVSSEDDYAEVN